MGDDRIGVVTITHNRRDEVLRTVGHMESVPEQPAMVVVDNASADGTADALARRFPDVRVIRAARNLGAAARNVGVAETERPYVAFCDDDTWWESGSLRRAADVLEEHPDIAVVTASIVVEPDGREDPICEELRDSPIPRPAGSPGPCLLSFLAGASMVRRKSFMDAGGFDHRFFIGGEEQLLACDLAAEGWRMVYLPGAVVHHFPSRARDPHLRRRQGIRNTLWFWWLRRPALAALQRSVHLLRTAPHDRVTLSGVVDALTGVPWVLRSRRVVPEDVEAGLRLLDEPQKHSRARRYIS